MMRTTSSAVLSRCLKSVWNRPEDAIYPDTGTSPLDGRNKYVIHFAKGALPPVNEFWSLTVYDLQGFTVPNPTNRYTLGIEAT